MNNLSLKEFISILRGKLQRSKVLIYLTPGAHVHHINGDISDDSLENLEVLTAGEHSRRHKAERLSAAKEIDWSIITSIELYGEAEVYDIEMEPPHHNFIAAGLVAHNCHHYGGCDFLGVCNKDPASRENFLRKKFYQRPWNPLKKRGI